MWPLDVFASDVQLQPLLKPIVGIQRQIGTLDDDVHAVEMAQRQKFAHRKCGVSKAAACQDDDFANFINPVEKYVASRTLTEPLEWQNSRLNDGDVEDFVTELKSRDGGEIAVCGSISLVRQLFFAGVLDELTLMTHPVIAGSGRRLFEEGDPLNRLLLKDQYATSKGNVITTYSLRKD